MAQSPPSSVLPEPWQGLTGKPILFAHAHPDDEAVATSSAMCLLAGAGATVHGVTATDGEATTRNMVMARAGGRRAETVTSYNCCGVPPIRQHFLRLSDGSLGAAEQFAKLVQALIGIMQRCRIQVLFTPGVHGFDGHPDHIAVHHACTAAAAQQQVELWCLCASKEGEVHIPVDTVRKRQAIAAHTSQLTVTTDHNQPGGYRVHELSSLYEPLLYHQESYRRLVC